MKTDRTGAPTLEQSRLAQFLTMSLGRFIGDTIKAMRDAEQTSFETRRIFDEQEKLGIEKDPWAFRRSRLLDNLAETHFRRVDAAHCLIAHLPADTVAEAAVLSIHLAEYLDLIDLKSIDDGGVGHLQVELDRAIAATDTIKRLLVRVSGLDALAFAIDHYDAVDPVDNDPLLIDPDAEVKRIAAEWQVVKDRCDEETCRHLEALAATEAVSLPGIAIKVKTLLRYRGDDADSGKIGGFESTLVSSLARDIERLMPGKADDWGFQDEKKAA